MRDVFCIMIDSDQIRAARGLLRWSAQELAKQAGLSLPTVQRMEAAQGTPTAYAHNLEAVQRAFEQAGVEFISRNGGGPGVRWKK